MPRVKRGTKRRANRKKTLALASGFFLTKSKLYRAAQEAVEKALRYGYVGRKRKKREYRSLWIIRINAGCKAAGISYSKFIGGLKVAGIDLNRKVLSEIAINDESGFRALVERAKTPTGVAAIAAEPAISEPIIPDPMIVEPAAPEAASPEPLA